MERSLHEVSALPINDIAALVNHSTECFIAYGTEVDPPALQMNLGLSSSSPNPIRIPTDLIPGTLSSIVMDP